MNFERAAKLILMLSSDNDGEVINAARMLTKMGIHEIADLIRAGGGGPINYPFTGFDMSWRHDFTSPPRHEAKRAKNETIERNVFDVVALFLNTLPELQVGDLDRKSITRFVKKLDMDFVLSAVKIACERMMPTPESAFRYFCGICWNEIRERQEVA